MRNLFAAATDLGQNIPHIDANQGTLALILNTLYGLIGLLAVIFVIVGGIRYSLAAGNASSVAKAKATILYAVIGLVISLMAFAITNFIINSINVTSTGALRNSIVTTLFTIAGIVTVIVIIVGGFKYVTSSGDSSKVKSAKDTVLGGVIGLVIALLAYAIVNFILGLI